MNYEMSRNEMNFFLIKVFTRIERLSEAIVYFKQNRFLFQRIILNNLSIQFDN